ncbi:hypothetical protein BT63DRAFT_452136 [Microthyrium microscopicum]|uniref:Uncharacterized protein n=1 Tax=Microthyrium microscopicum TaxID=703497 RepID=A0A6A6UIK9_9PEZI|nr:hypothetical protein BT63DRAFT_452136 [Microthyrium microscopicum]
MTSFISSAVLLLQVVSAFPSASLNNTLELRAEIDARRNEILQSRAKNLQRRDNNLQRRGEIGATGIDAIAQWIFGIINNRPDPICVNQGWWFQPGGGPSIYYHVNEQSLSMTPFEICYMQGNQVFTSADAEIVGCLADLHSRQQSHCISVKGSVCDNGYIAKGGRVQNMYLNNQAKTLSQDAVISYYHAVYDMVGTEFKYDVGTATAGSRFPDGQLVLNKPSAPAGPSALQWGEGVNMTAKCNTFGRGIRKGNQLTHYQTKEFE